MPKTKPPYALELGRQMVELVRAGRTPEELSEFEPSAPTIRPVEFERRHRAAEPRNTPSPR